LELLKKYLLFLVIPVVFSLIIIDVYADSFARPDSSTLLWSVAVGLPPCSTLSPHLCVDEPRRDDSDFIRSVRLGNGVTQTQTMTLSNIPDPFQSTGHVLSYTIREGNQGTNPVGFSIALRESQRTIATFTHAQGTLSPSTFTLFQQTLTNTQADSITNYNNLELTLTAFCTSGCSNAGSARESVDVSWIEFKVVIIPIQPPVLNSVTAINYNTLQLSWTEPADKSRIISYTIERNSGSGFVPVVTVGVGTTSILDSGLQGDTLYTYRIKSNAINETSPPSNELSQRTPPEPPKTPPPKVEISAENVGKAILVKWIIPLDETSNSIGYKWVLQRIIDEKTFTDIANGERNLVDKPLENGKQIEYYLDKIVSLGVTYSYRIIFSSVDGRDNTVSDATVSVFIPSESSFILKSKGTLLETTRVITPRNGGITKVVMPTLDIFNNAFAETGGLSPLITSSVNPKDEPYLFSLSPIPSPVSGHTCEQALEIIYKRNNGNLGQDLTVFATILEDQTIVRNQHLYDSVEISNSGDHIFNYWWVIPPSEQMIVDFTNLEVQLDIDSSDTINPFDYRSLSIYQVNLYVPESNQVC